MGLFGRLFGSPPVEVPANSVVIPDDLAAELTSGGASLSAAVETACRNQLKVPSAPVEAEGSGAMPFWLDRSEAATAAGSGDLEDQLRDRVIERHSGEGDT